MTQQVYVVRLMFEWGGGSLWCGNDAALTRFDVGPIEDLLPLSDAVRAQLDDLSAWHDKALNRDYPPDPGPWSADEFARFAVAAQSMKASLERELGPEFEVVYVPLGEART